jgi:hypothetical protein
MARFLPRRFGNGGRHEKHRRSPELKILADEPNLSTWRRFSVIVQEHVMIG